MTKVFTPEKVIKYAETRLFGSNIYPDDIRHIELYNGILPSALENILGKFERVEQENGREPIYFKEDTLSIPQYSGFGRRKRYESMINEYIKASKRKISFGTHDLDDEPRKTNIEYDNFAYDFVVGLFVPNGKYEKRRVFKSNEIEDITKIIFGPIEAVAKQAKVIEKGNSEYLDAQLVSINRKKALNIGYVYADQAGIIIDKILREYEALARKEDNEKQINIFMFGRVGGLAENARRHQLVYPNGIVDNEEEVYPMNNILTGKNKGLNLNVVTAIDETIEQLEKARENGCICVEMETRESAESINRAKRRYKGSLDINFGFVGHISDLPLEGDTLADELESDKGEQAAVKKIISAISKR